MSEALLDERRRALENAFFAERDRALIADLRDAEQTEAGAEELRKVLGEGESALVDRLVALGVRADTLAALRLVPLIYVAWADGNLDPAERKAVLNGAVAMGLPEDGPLYGLLDEWLQQAPPQELFEAWSAYASAIRTHHSPDDARLLHWAALDGARSVARAAGGFLGIGAVSGNEASALDELEHMFDPNTRDRAVGPMRVETILVATDFSPAAEAAVAEAGAIARQHGARVVLFHALVPPTFLETAPEFIAMPAEVHEAQRSNAVLKLSETAEGLRDLGLEVDVDLRMGLPQDAVRDAVRRWGADLVVVGTRGWSGVKRAVLGSAAAHIVRDCLVPVITVHPEKAAAVPSAAARIQRVLIPTDFSDDAARALEEAVRVLGPVEKGGTVHLLHVYRIPVVAASPWSVELVEQSTREIEAEARERLEEMAAPLRETGVAVETMVVRGDPADVIDREARRLDVDLVAMGTYGRSGIGRMFFGSVAERVLPEAPCPVLTVRVHVES